MTGDPLVVWSVRVALALLLGAAAAHKLRARGDFAIVLADYGLVPRRALAAAAWAIPVLEASLAGGLLSSPTAVAAAGLASALFVGYGVAMGINLLRGRTQLSCGCLGPAAEQPVHVGLLARNAVLAGAAMLAAVEPVAREWTGLDALSLGTAVASLALLYLASEGLQSAGLRMREVAR